MTFMNDKKYGAWSISEFSIQDQVGILMSGPMALLVSFEHQEGEALPCLARGQGNRQG
jgi:hypothetical protein